jgi:hypothetical protein
MHRILCCLCLILPACDPEKGLDTGDEGAWRPDLACPGDPSGVCDEVAGSTLEAGAGLASIVPACFESWTDLDGNAEYHASSESFLDCGCDRICEGDPGWTAPDRGEGDGQFQAVWMAGFQSGRPATGVRGAGTGLRGENDGIWARALVLRQGESSLAIVTLDLIGWFNHLAIESGARVREAGLDVDHVLIHSLHPHEGPDTMGMWGPSATRSGVDPEYVEQVHAAVVEAVSEALASAEPVSRLVAGQVDISAYSVEKGACNVVSDHRDPFVVDETLSAARFEASDGRTLATLVQWASHPETLSDENNLITSDFVHALRETVEQGVAWDSRSREGVGGVALYVNGPLGGMMTPLGVTTTDPDGRSWGGASFEKADAIGQLLGEMALDVLEEGSSFPEPSLSFARAATYLDVENWMFQAAMRIGIFDRPTYNWDEARDVDEDNMPQVASEVNLVEIGPIRMLSLPGEPLPELVLGGYDGSHVNCPGQTLLDPANPNPPDLSLAPSGPALRDRLGGSYNWIMGLGNDEVGYLIPAFEYELDETLPYIEEAEGDHYEETNSLGPGAAPALEELAIRLIEWKDAHDAR